MDTVAVIRGDGAAGRVMVASDGQQPVFARTVLFAQDGRGDREVAIRVKQFAGLSIALHLITQVDLPQADIDPRGRQLL